MEQDFGQMTPGWPRPANDVGSTKNNVNGVEVHHTHLGTCIVRIHGASSHPVTQTHGWTNLSNGDISKLIRRFRAHDEVTCCKRTSVSGCGKRFFESITHLVCARLNSMSTRRRHNDVRTPWGILGPLLGPCPRLVCRARRGVDECIFWVFLPVRNRSSSSAPCVRTRVQCTRT